MARRYKPKRYSAALGNFNRTIRSTAGSGRALVLATQYQQLDSEKTAEALKRAAKTARASIKEIADKGQSSLTFEEIQDRLSDLDAEQQRLNIWFASAQAANESAELQAAIIEYSSIISELRVQLESIIMGGGLQNLPSIGLSGNT